MDNHADFLLAPPEVIATFPKPNFINPETHGPGLIIVGILFNCLGAIIIATRFYARIFITRALGIDDWLILVAFAFGTALTALVIEGNVKYYNGHHVWDIPIGSAVGHRINVWIAQVCFTAALSFVKISVLLFYRRLSVSFTWAFLVATWVGIVYNILYLAGFILALLLACSPTRAYWMSWDREWAATHDFKCVSEEIVQPLSAALSIIGDIYSTTLPMILISRVRLPRKQKYALYSLFSVGFFVIIAGIVRGIYVYRTVNVDYDFTWTLWKVWIWGEVEIWFAISAASAPALKPFFKRFLIDKVLSTWGSAAPKSGNRVYFVRSDGYGGLQDAEVVRKITSDPHGRDEEANGVEVENPNAVGKKSLADLKGVTEIETKTWEQMSKLQNASHSSMAYLQPWRRMKKEPRQLKISRPIQLPAPLDQLRQNTNAPGKSRIHDQNRDVEMRTVDVVPNGQIFVKPLPPVPETKSRSKT